MIELTEKEQELFSLLLDVVDKQGKSTTLRVAGGWVRDKILYHGSHDIDIALDDQSGFEFATAINEYLAEKNLETRTIAVIQANPDQSKHLETVNLKVLGMEIDFVHLRSETYTDTRIPQITKATAVEDAMRRDFTINALFYNLNNRTVEDFTNSGIRDLDQKILRTPIDPFVTFRDDPLRILRAVRFASRLYFQLAPELIVAARDSRIREALLEKVSRERIYKECEGMMNHVNIRPSLSFLLMFHLHILDVVLPTQPILHSHSSPVIAADVRGINSGVSDWSAGFLPRITACPLVEESLDWETWPTVTIDVVYWVHILSILKRSSYQLTEITAEALREPLRLQSGDVSVVKSLFWAAAVMRFSGLSLIEKKKEVSFYTVLLREGLKMENLTLRNVAILIDAAKDFLAVGSSQSLSLIKAAAILRSAKELWKEGLLLALAYVLAHRTSIHRQLIPFMQRTDDYSQWFQTISISSEIREIIQEFHALETMIVEEYRLEGIWQLKPLFDGSQLMHQLGITVKGPMIGRLLEEQIRWQIAHLHDCNASPENCLQHLRDFLASSA